MSEKTAAQLYRELGSLVFCYWRAKNYMSMASHEVDMACARVFFDETKLRNQRYQQWRGLSR